MADQHNQITGDIYGVAVQAGSIDEVHFHGQVRQTYPPLTDWTNRPELPRALAELLDSQREATEALPYRLLDVTQPPLTAVYVHQNAVRVTEQKTTDSGERDRERAQPLTEVLDGSQHLVITGEAGAGKSTLGHMYVQWIAKFWLDQDHGKPPISEPVLPLRIPARALAGDGSWGELLVAGAMAAANRRPTERPRPDLFTSRALGARWLIFIDGLDEITSADTQAEVIRTIAAQMRHSADHRLVVTTRSFLDDRLKPFIEAGAASYSIQPLGQADLHTFARKWFDAQNPLTGKALAEEFIREVREDRLRELVRNPLLATIAAIAKTKQPRRKLPNSRADLYGWFLRHLLFEQPSGRDTAAELRRSAHDQPSRLALIEWLSQQRTTLIGELAVEQVESGAPTLALAETWVHAHQTIAAELPDGWASDLSALLFGSGLFVNIGGGPRFLHHSFAEFLAAQQRAARIPPDFPGLTTWINDGLVQARRDYVLFTFVLWGRREGHDVGRILRRLLDGDQDRLLLAGRLLAEDVTVTAELGAEVVDRLVQCILTSVAGADPWDDSNEIGKVLTAIGGQVISEPVIDRLRTLRDQPELAEVTRIEAAVALGRLADTDAAVRWLEGFADRVDALAIRRIAKVLVDLTADGQDRAERIALRLAASAGPHYAITAAAIAIMQEIDRAEQSAPLIRDLVHRLRTDSAVVTGRSAMPSTASNQPDPMRIHDAWYDASPTWGAIAAWAASAKCDAEARWAVGMVFRQSEPEQSEFRGAVDVFLSVAGPAGVAEIMTDCAGRSAPYLGAAAGRLLFAGHPAEAAELARRVLADPLADREQFLSAIRIVRSSDPTGLDLLAIATGLSTADRLRLARWADRPDTDTLARTVLDDPGADPNEFTTAAELLLVAAGPAAAAEIQRAALDRPQEYWAAAALVLIRADHHDLGTELLNRLCTEPHVDVDVLLDTAEELLSADLVPAAVDTLDAILNRAVTAPDDQRRLADALRRIGRDADAVAYGRRALRNAIAKGEAHLWFADTWLNVLGTASADELLAQLLTADLTALSRMSVAEELVDRGLLGPAATMWLDVLRYHGEAVDQGVLAADRLVRCGYREQAVATLTEALARDRLPGLARARLRALLAWLGAFSPAELSEAELSEG